MSSLTDHNPLSFYPIITPGHGVIELVSYKLLLIQGCTKNETKLQTLHDPNVIFHWELISDIADEVTSLTLLKEVIGLWFTYFTIRGFSVANRLFEEYRIASKMNIKGKNITVTKKMHF